MDTYHKIEGIFVREDERPHKMLWGQYRNPVWKDLEQLEWIFTEKIDGTNIRVHWDGHTVIFGGRTDNAQLQTSLLNRLAELFSGTANEQVFEQNFGDTPVTLYGEGFGVKIQKGGGDYLDTQDFALFDVKISGNFQERSSVEDIAKKFQLKIAPVVFEGTLDKAILFAKKGFKSKIAQTEREAEGMVGTPKCNVLTRTHQRVIVKLKTNDLQNQIKATPNKDSKLIDGSGDE